MDRYQLLAHMLVAVIPLGALTVLVGAVLWSRDAISRAPGIGWTGTLLFLAATAQLFVPRRFGEVVNRPLFAAFTGGGHAERAGMIGIAVVLLIASATAVAVRYVDLRRS